MGVSPPSEIQFIFEQIRDNWDGLSGSEQKKTLEDMKKAIANEFKGGITSAPDIALFGRMLASKGVEMGVDAAAQMAHAISTHKVSMEMDFFTAVDDLQKDEDPGAGMMGTIEFNSACFYRYSLIDIGQLIANLDGDKELAVKTAEAFIRASIAAIPTGKQTSMAAQNPPSFIMVVVRSKGQPWSLANAFSKPVSLGGYAEKDLIGESIHQMTEYMGNMLETYGSNGIDMIGHCAIGNHNTTKIPKAKGYSKVDDLISETRGTINDCINDAS